MNWKQVLAGVAVLGIVACGGGSDPVTNPPNHAPVVAFTFNPLATAKNVPVDLTITATDEDDDPLTISWTVTRGTLTAQNSKKTVMRWAVPATIGVDTVNVSVTDGTATKKVSAQIAVANVYSNSGIFLKSLSPYILATAANGRLTVGENTTLTIQAGTEIYINSAGVIIDVLGKLVAHGTLADPIIIRHNNRSFKCGESNPGWKGIQVSHSAGAINPGSADLEYVELWYPTDGVLEQDSTRVTMKNCSVRCSGHASVWMQGSGSLFLTDSRFTDGAGHGLLIEGIASRPDSVMVKGCTLSFNNGSGIHMDLYDTIKSAVIDVQENDIEYNQTHGIALAHSVFPTIHFNQIKSNGGESISNLYLQSGYPTVSFPELDATCNYWGNTSQTTIDIGIHDSLDQSTVHARVKSSPWLFCANAPNCGVSCP